MVIYVLLAVLFVLIALSLHRGRVSDRPLKFDLRRERKPLWPTQSASATTVCSPFIMADTVHSSVSQGTFDGGAAATCFDGGSATSASCACDGGGGC